MAALVLCATGCAQKSKTVKNSKALVAYYSATGTTAAVAKQIADATGATLYEIKPQQTYTAADLNWNDKQSRSTLEMADPKARPAIVADLTGLDNYDTIYVGFPIWWDLPPRVINTFIETYKLEGKTIIPFATSGGSSITNSVRQLRQDYPALTWKDGRLLNSPDADDIKRLTE